MIAAETHETLHQESGMRYQPSPHLARSEFRSGPSLPVAARCGPLSAVDGRSADTVPKRAGGASERTLGVNQAHAIGQPVGVVGPMPTDEVGQPLGGEVAAEADRQEVSAAHVVVVGLDWIVRAATYAPSGRGPGQPQPRCGRHQS